MYQKHWHHDFEYSDRLINTGIGSEEFFKSIEVTLPPVVSRAELARLTGGLISTKTLSNEDGLQKGPRERVGAGSKIGYTKMAVMAYLRTKIKPL